MSHLSTYRAYSNAETRGRVAMAAMAAGAFILLEDPKTEAHVARRSLAEKVTTSPLDYEEPFLLAALQNPDVAGKISDDGSLGSTDSDLDYVVASVWTDVALRLRF